MAKLTQDNVQALLERLAVQHERVSSRRLALADAPEGEALPEALPAAPQARPMPARGARRADEADPALRQTRQFAGHLGHLYGRSGRPALEGGLTALLLSRPGPVPLAEAARVLGVTGATVARLARAMEGRGDLEREDGPAGAAYRLTDRAGTRQMRHWRDLSLEAARLCEAAADALGRDDPEARERLLAQAGLHGWAAVALGRVLSLRRGGEGLE